MAVPTVLPTEATPLDFGHKRKHSQVIDLTGDDDEDVAAAIQPPPGNREDQLHQGESQHTEATTNGSTQIDDDDDEILEQMLEDLDGAQPFIDGKGLVCTGGTKMGD